MREQFAVLLAEIGFIQRPARAVERSAGQNVGRLSMEEWVDAPEQPWNKHALQPAVVKAVLCAGLYANVAMMDTTQPHSGSENRGDPQMTGSELGMPGWQGASLGCLDPALTIAAYMSYKSPFASAHDMRDAAERARVALAATGSGTLAAGQQCDQLVVVTVYDGWRAARKRGGRRAAAAYCKQQFLSAETLEMLRE
eukprot:gene30187-37711_t